MVTNRHEAWVRIDLEKVPGLKRQHVKALERAGIATIGDLADFTAADGELDQVAGIGEAGADTIREIIVAFVTKQER